MELSFQTEGFHQYIVLNVSGFDMDSYEINMLMQFKGKSLLPLNICGQHGRMQLRYDVSGAATLEQISKEQEFKGVFLKNLFQSIWDAYGELEEYLLPVGGILLEPEMIYYQPGKKQIEFGYLPGRENSFQAEFLKLVEFCMKNTDHEDSNAVMFIYGLYRYIKSGHTSREEIQAFICNADTETNKKEDIIDKHPKNEYQKNEYPKDAYIKNVMGGNAIGITEEAGMDDYNNDNASVHEKIQYGKESRGGQKAFYLYGGGFVLSVCAMLVFGVRFFIITRQEQDLKVFIILILVSMVFMYSAVKRKGMRGKLKSKEIDLPESECGQITEQNLEQWEETQVLRNISTEGDMENAAAVSNIIFWEMESLSTSVPSIQLNQLPGVLGRRAEDVDYVIGGEGISRRHAVIFLSGSDLYVEDLNSTNGTYVDNVRLNPGEPLLLKEESVLRIGPNTYRLKKKGEY